MYLDDQHPINVRSRPADITANAMFSGPTPVDFSMLPNLAAPKEPALLAQWRAADLTSHYRAQRSNRR